MTQSTNEQRNFVRSLSKRHSLSLDESLIDDFDYCRAFLNKYAYLIKADESPARPQSFLSFSCEMIINVVAVLLFVTIPFQIIYFYVMFFVIPKVETSFVPLLGFAVGLFVGRLVFEYFNHFATKRTKLYLSVQQIIWLLFGYGCARLAYQLFA